MLRTKKLYFFVFLAFWFGASNSLQLFSSNCKCKSKEENGKLIFSHVIHRIGKRAPYISYPEDQQKCKAAFPLGFVQLTNSGKDQTYAFGRWLRKRYSKFLTNTYSDNEIYIRSSDVDRALMSAQTVAAGLYPPQFLEIWNYLLRWQPIPVHTVPYDTDYITGGTDGADLPACPAYTNAYNTFITSGERSELDHSYQPIYDMLSEKFGEVVDRTNVWKYDDLFGYNSEVRQPQWTKSIDKVKLKQASLRGFHLPSGTKFLAKYRSGFLLKEILDRCDSKISNSLVPDRKLWLYLTHGPVIGNFLNTLGIFDKEFVPFASAVIVELREIEGNHFIQIFYKNSSEEPKAVNIPKCGTLCSLDQMYELFGSILPRSDSVIFWGKHPTIVIEKKNSYYF